MTILVAVLGAALGFIAQWVIQRFVLNRTREQEREMHRATLAAEAFADFFAAVSRTRTVSGTIENHAEGIGPALSDPDAFVRSVDDLNIARGKLAAVAPPAVIRKLAELDSQGRPGFTARSLAAQNALTDIMQTLRTDLGVAPADNHEQLRTVLFGHETPSD